MKKKVESWEQIKELIDTHLHLHPNTNLNNFFEAYKDTHSNIKDYYYHLKPEEYLFPGQRVYKKMSKTYKKRRRRKDKVEEEKTPAQTFIEVLESPSEKEQPTPPSKSKDKVSALLEIARMINES